MMARVPSNFDEEGIPAAVAWARLNLAEPITVTTLASKADMERTTFTRAFTSAIGKSPGAWLREERVEAAKRMIENSYSPLETVARQCGFTRPQAFARTFRDIVGVSPREYRGAARVRDLASQAPSRHANGGVGAYPKDLRLKVLHEVDRGVPQKRAAEMFGIHPGTLRRWLKRRREAGDVGPGPTPVRKPLTFVTQEERRALWEQLETHAEASLERHCALWEERRGVRVSRATMGRAVGKLGWTHKNKRWQPPIDADAPGAGAVRP